MIVSSDNAHLLFVKTDSGYQQSPIVDMLMTVCHEGAQEDEVLRAAMLHKR
jgi:hypothetical protein